MAGFIVGDLFDAEGEGVEVEHQFAVVYDSAAGDVGVADEEVPAGVFAGVLACSVHHVPPVFVVGVAVVHDFDLSEVDCFYSDVDVACDEVGEPHSCFDPAHVGDG